MATNRYAGTVWDKGSTPQVPVAGVRVDALDLRGRVRDVVASAVSDAQGYFELTVSEEQLAYLFGDTTPIVYFRAVVGSNVIASTEKTNRWNAKRSSGGRIEVNQVRPIGVADPLVYSVEGLAADMETGPLGSTTVKIYKRSISGVTVAETLVASGTTASNGRYRIPYDPAGTSAPDLVVRATDGAGTEIAKATVCKALPRTFADLLAKGTVNGKYVGQTRYANALAAVDSLRGTVARDALTATQVDFIACQTATSQGTIVRDDVDAIVNAAKLNVLNPTVAQEVFFAFTRKGIAATNDAVFAHRLPMLQKMIEDAAADRTISPAQATSTNLTATMGLLQTAARAALRATGTGKARLGQLVDNAPGAMTGTERDAFLNKALNFEGSATAFWAAVDADTSFTAAGKKRFRFAVEASAIAGAYFPMVQALHARVGAGSLIDDPKELAKYEAADWDGIINTLSGVPAGTPGSTLAEQRVNYRNALLKSAETRFRSARIKWRVRQTEAPASALRKFFELGNNPTFEFEVHRVGRYLLETPGWLTGLTPTEQTDAVKRLRDIERVFKITESWDEANALLSYSGGALTSSYAVHQMGREAFLNAFSALGATAAGNIFEKACWRASSAALIRAKYSPRHEVVKLGVLPDLKTNTASLPTKIGDWQTLFGTLDQCSCEHCRSVLGPAAYLVDMLEMLERVPATPSGNAKQTLLNRRPDLQQLALSCENANTPLPYVDVANEIMEVRLAQATWPNWPSTPNPIDTLPTADELAAQPEVLYPTQHLSAYTTLSTNVHPFTAPFHLWMEEARVYLDHLGVSRDELLKIFAPSSAGPNTRHLALERLRISGNQFDSIASPAAAANTYWGISAGNWPTDLNLAKNLMEKGSLTFDELRELLSTEYCTTNAIGFPTNAACDLATLQVNNLNGPGGATDHTRRNFLHQLLRLRTALGFSITDTDRARFAFGGTGSTLDSAKVIKLATVKKLVAKLGVAPVEVLSWFADMDKQSAWEPSLFERVFLNRRVLAPAVTAFQNVFTSGTDATQLSAVQGPLAFALGLSDADLRLLIDDTAASGQMRLPVQFAPSTTLSLPTLSRLFRIASFARAIGKTVKELLVLRGFTGALVLAGDIAGTIDPQTMLDFLDTVARLERTGLSVDEAHYVIRHVSNADGPLPSTSTLTDWDADLSARIARAAEEARNLADPQVAVVAANQVTQLTSLAVALGLDPTTVAALGADTLVSPDPTTYINGTLAPFVGDSADAVAKLVTALTKLTDVPTRNAYLVQRLARYLNAANAAKEWCARTFSMPSDVTAALLGSGASESAVLKYLTKAGYRAFIPTSSSPGSWGALPSTQSERFILYVKLHKMAILVDRLALTVDDFATLYPNGGAPSAGLPFFDVQGLATSAPTAPSSPAINGTEQAYFTALLRLGDYAYVRDRYPSGAKAFRARLAGPNVSLPAIYDAIALDTQFDRTDTQDVSELLGGVASSFQNEAIYVRLFKGIETLRQMGATAAKVKGWVLVESPVPVDYSSITTSSYTIAREIKALARAKHDDASWAEVARDLRNPLREKQRQALVGALLDKLGVANSDRLFENLLVDVDMSPCAITSRLVAAHASVQMFTNRVTLNLESGLAPTKQLGREWEWMHAYRLWEANRKVFLWPENWIEPELRGDKTPLFKALENDLLQGPLTKEHVENAYRAYLYGLSDIGNLEIVALHTEKKSGVGTSYALNTSTIVHVFGRTRQPRRYYYRRRDATGWTPWEKVELDIQGENLVPVTLGGRLYLFWATVEDKAKPPEPISADPPPTPPSATDDEVRNSFLELVSPAPAAPPPPVTQDDSGRPTPLNSLVRLFMAEERDGVWSASEAVSRPVELDVSPFRPFVSLQATTSGSRISISVLFRVHVLTFASSYVVAKFNYDVASALAGGERRAILDDKSGAFPSNIVSPTIVPGSSPMAITTPHPVFSYQAFSASGQVRAYLSQGGDPIPSAVLFSTMPWTDSRLVVNRGAEPALERQHMVFQDRKRSLFLEVKSRTALSTGNIGTQLIADEIGVEIATNKYAGKDVRIEPFFHPFVHDFRTRVATLGLDGLLRQAEQTSPNVQEQSTDIMGTYSPNASYVETSTLKETVDFRLGSPYGIYNWELFFHAPFLIANRLSSEGRYREAREWYHTIFNPIDGSTAPLPGLPDGHVRYWKFKPFADNKDLATIQAELSGSAQTAYAQEMEGWANGQVTTQTPVSDTFTAQVALWRDDPFDPHAIARLRVVAYQKAVVQKYVANLIAWGDSLFAQDTIETINEATQLYVHALQLLGPKPTLIPDPVEDPAQSYAQLDATSSFDAFKNALVDVEVIVPRHPADGFVCKGGKMVPSSVTGSPYFCTPINENLLALWDTISDRLFKIRHCQNIEGVVRALPLYQPPIDPALLVRAKAAGLDLSSVLNDLQSSVPPYRYTILAARAAEYTNAVLSLGQALLAALEKKDAEHLAQLRAGHEVANFELTRALRKTQLSEAEASLDAAKRSLTLAEKRFEYYDSRDFMSPGEITAMALGQVAEGLSIGAQLVKAAASQVAVMPDGIFGVAGVGGSPVSLVKYGAENFSRSGMGAGDALELSSRAVSTAAGVTSTLAGYARRQDDWDFQAKQAKLEIAQIEKQILAAEIRVSMAKQELNLLEQQLRQSRDVEAHLRTKFTNEDLYGWMKGQLQATHYQSYKLAYEMARAAERAWRFERADDTQSFIKFDAWDGSKLGLLAGEKLAADLRRMDSAYHTQNAREYELLKTISLAQLSPDNFLKIRDAFAGGGSFSLPEALFNDDFKTHYLRRIKSTTVSVHCTPGPYQSVMGRLDLLKGQTRLKATDLTVTDRLGSVSSIATSTAQSESGMFELNFRDDRYLPFEGAGAHCDSGTQWRFELTGGNEFDYDSISDVVLALRYTAREGLAVAATQSTTRNMLWRLLHTHADAWQSFKDTNTPLALALSAANFAKPKSRNLGNVTTINVYAQWAAGTTSPTMNLTTTGGTLTPPTPQSGAGFANTLTKYTWTGNIAAGTAATWTLTPASTQGPSALTDLWIAFTYGLTP